jgi:hypothetical protein
MFALTFETKRYRVQIVGKSAWVECYEDARWIFRTQHPLPLAFGALQARRDSTTAVLRSAVDHFERTRNGDLTLREALTGVRNGASPVSSKVEPIAAARSNPAKAFPRSGFSRSVSSQRQDVRMPLRPPLTAQ